MFNVGFQENPEHRIQSASDLLARLDNLVPPSGNDSEELLRQEMERMRDTLQSSSAQAMARFQRVLDTASKRFDRIVKEQVREAKLLVAVGGPTPVSEGTAVEANYGVFRPNTDQPRAQCRHRVEVKGSDYVGSLDLESSGWQQYYCGPVGDVDSFAEAADAQAVKALTTMLRTLREKLGRA